MSEEPRPDESVVAPSAWEHALIWVGFPLAGAAAGWLLKVVAAWAPDLSWIPVPGRVDFIVDIATASYATPIALIGGAVAGLTVAVYAKAEQVVVTVHDDHVRIDSQDAQRRIERSEIAAVFVDDKRLVIQGHRGDEPIRETTDLDQPLLEDAFRAHGYPWTTADPRGHEFRRWVPELDGLPADADPLLKARHAALENDDADDAAQLRDELARVGVVVRDEGTSRQFVRTIDDPGSAV